MVLNQLPSKIFSILLLSLPIKIVSAENGDAWFEAKGEKSNHHVHC